MRPSQGLYNPAMPPRFFVPNLTGIDIPATLPVSEAAHLTRVLRLAAGDVVSVFDGRGAEYLARVEKVGSPGVTVLPCEHVVPAPEPKVALTVAAALLKGRTFDAIVRDVTMVGAIAVQPLATTRTEARGRHIERWARIAVASAKQCRRAVVPEVRAPQSLGAFFDHDRSAVRLLLAEPGASELGTDTLRVLAAESAPSSATLAIGPEGGWSSHEVDAAKAAGFVPITFGRLTLRADAVVVSAVSVLQYIWGDL